MNQAEQRAERHMSMLQKAEKGARAPLRTALAFGLGLASSGAALLADHHFNNTSIVEAADPECSFNLLVIGGLILDNPVEPNRKGLTDFKDYVLGGIEMGEAVVNRQDDPKNPNSARQELRRGDMVVKDDHSRVNFRDIKAVPNTKGEHGKPAVRVSVSFALDPIKQEQNPLLPVEVSGPIECGETGVAYGGRAAIKDNIMTALRGGFVIRKFGTIMDRVSREFYGRAAGVAPAIDNPAKNLTDLKNNTNVALENALAVKAKEKSQAPKPSTPPEIPGGGKGDYTPPANQPDNRNQASAPEVAPVNQPEGGINLASAADFANQNSGGLFTLAAMGVVGVYKGYRKVRGI